jgi:hypothetical protein
MSELERLDQPQSPQLREIPLFRQLGCLAQPRESPLEVVEPLDPADVGTAYGWKCVGIVKWRKSGNLTGFGFVHDGGSGLDRIDLVDNVVQFNSVNSVNRVNISLSLKFRSQLPGKGPMQQ